MIHPSRVGLLVLATAASALLAAGPVAEASPLALPVQSCVPSAAGVTPETTCPTTPTEAPDEQETPTSPTSPTPTPSSSSDEPAAPVAPNSVPANRRVVPNNDAPAPQRAGRPAGDRDCADFATQQQAQQYFESIVGSATNNADRLDANGNGVACESLADDGDNQDAEATTTGDDGSTAKTSGDQVTEVPEGSAQTGGA